jgi:hypothetical protein
MVESDKVVVTGEIPRSAFDGMTTNAERKAYIREQAVEQLGWQRLVDLLPLIDISRRTRIANVGQFIHGVLSRDKPGAASALTDMVSDGTITDAERTAILGVFQE